MARDGVVLYAGPSALDDAPIALIVTGLEGSSKNTKTGAVVQSWIIRTDVDPVNAIRTGKDRSVCGFCPLRGTGQARGCYVRVHWSVLAVYNTYKKGGYPRGTPRDVAGKVLRLSAYGDPAALPAAGLLSLLESPKRVLGYTHQWRAARHLRDWCLASVETPALLTEAFVLHGWKTFRILSMPDHRVSPSEIMCPAMTREGKKVGFSCKKCRLCVASRGSPNIAVPLHGDPCTVSAYKDLFFPKEEQLELM